MLAFSTLLSIGVMVAWISGFLGYRAQGAMSKAMRRWLAICGVAAAYVVGAQVAEALNIFSGTLNTVVRYTAYLGALVVTYWFIAGTARGPGRAGKRRHPGGT